MIQYWREFNPGIKGIILESWYLWAKGLDYNTQGLGYELYGWPHCYICGRKKDFIFDFVRLIPYFDMTLDNKLVYICDDHGRVANYDCTTGEPITLPLPRPYWYRRVRNSLQALVLNTSIALRFIWFTCFHAFMWYMFFWFYLAWQRIRSMGTGQCP